MIIMPIGEFVNELLDFYLQIGNEWFRFGLDDLCTINSKYTQHKKREKYRFFAPFRSEKPLGEHLKEIAANLEKQKRSINKGEQLWIE